MGDWRAMGQGVRRRMGKPSAHSVGARNPSQLPRFVNSPGEDVAGRTAGRPEGTTRDDSFWDRAAKEDSASFARAGEDQWTRELKARQGNHPSLQHKRMRPDGGFFG